MKKLSLFLFHFVCIPVLFGFDQELKAELINANNEQLLSCNCRQLGSGDRVKIRINLPEKVFKYDMVQFNYYDQESKKLLLKQQISGKKLSAEYENTGYFEYVILQKDIEKIYDKGGGICTQREDYSLVVEATGFFITGYRETEDSKGIKTTSPVYGERQDFGATNAISVNVSDELRQSANEKKFIRGCASVVLIIIGTFLEILNTIP